jgi:hypothetical protein
MGMWVEGGGGEDTVEGKGKTRWRGNMEENKGKGTGEDSS